MEKMNEFIKALKEGKGYDWISRNGHELNKYELIDIVKEYDYAIHSTCSNWLKMEIYESAAEELNEVYEYVEED